MVNEAVTEVSEPVSQLNIMQLESLKMLTCFFFLLLSPGFHVQLKSEESFPYIEQFSVLGEITSI